MIKIKQAQKADTAILALLSRQTYIESHGHFIEDKNDLKVYTEKAFSVSKTEQDLNDTKNLFHIVYVNDATSWLYQISTKRSTRTCCISKQL